MTGSEVFALLLYLVQQLGVMLGVGAALITLIAHLVSTRDGVIEPAEARFARAIERVLMIGLFCMISSGVFITALHSTAGQAVIIFTPAFVFKWLLIGVVTLPLIIGHKNPFPPLWFEGFIGGTWFALFALHIVAPIASWTALILLYAIWLVIFFIAWNILVKLLHARDPGSSEQKAPVLAAAGGMTIKPLISPILVTSPKPKASVAQVPPQTPPPPAPTPPPAPPPVAPPPQPEVGPPPKPPPPPSPVSATMPPPPKPAAPAVPLKLPQKPTEKFTNIDSLVDLPAVRVMPRTLEDIEKQSRPTIVEFN